MTPLSRRTFALSGAAAVVAARKGFTFASPARKLEVRVDREIGTIRPELHGHFAEHLGSCVYGGLWVGKGSSIPNIDGFRRDAVNWLKAVGIPVLRWPGGCFADDYHWRDGIGPAAKRPRRVNIHWGNYTEDNSFGTHEFIALCRLIGAQPYLAGNVGSGTPDELRNWIEYCNYPAGSTLADERIANGAKAPFGVKYWGVGNENWGCGGQMTGEEYAEHYRRFVTFLRTWRDPRPFLIACGPSKNDIVWTRGFFEGLRKRGPVDGYAMHFYSRGANFATKFNAKETAQNLMTFADLEAAILEQRRLMNTWDPDGRIGLMIDEWGVWDRMAPEEEKKYGRLWMQITMRTAVAAALGLNVFHRQADKLIMGNIAQIVNVLHSLLLTDGPDCVRTSTYYAFEMMKAHRGQKSLRTETGDPEPLGLSVSASRAGKDLTLTLVNPRTDAGMSVECSLAGASATGATARLLHHPDMNAFNGFKTPDTIVPKPLAIEAKGANVKVSLPPLSMATALVKLG